MSILKRDRAAVIQNMKDCVAVFRGQDYLRKTLWAMTKEIREKVEQLEAMREVLSSTGGDIHEEVRNEMPRMCFHLKKRLTEYRRICVILKMEIRKKVKEELASPEKRGRLDKLKAKAEFYTRMKRSLESRLASLSEVRM